MLGTPNRSSFLLLSTDIDKKIVQHLLTVRYSKLDSTFLLLLLLLHWQLFVLCLTSASDALHYGI